MEFNTNRDGGLLFYDYDDKTSILRSQLNYNSKTRNPISLLQFTVLDEAITSYIKNKRKLIKLKELQAETEANTIKAQSIIKRLSKLMPKINETEIWFDTDDGPFGYQTICEHLGFSPSAIRARLPSLINIDKKYNGVRLSKADRSTREIHPNRNRKHRKVNV